MNTLFFLLLLATLTLTLKIDMPSSVPLELSKLNVQIPIRYSENQGPVTIRVQGLPQGLSFAGEMIAGATGSKNGYFPILIDIEDSKGNSASKICVLKIGSASATTETSSSSTQYLQSGDSNTITTTTTITNIGAATSSNFGSGSSISGSISSGLPEINDQIDDLINRRSSSTTGSSSTRISSILTQQNSDIFSRISPISSSLETVSSETRQNNNIDQLLSELSMNRPSGSSSSSNSLNLDINPVSFTSESPIRPAQNGFQLPFSLPSNQQSNRPALNPSIPNIRTPSSESQSSESQSAIYQTTYSTYSNSNIPNLIRTSQAPKSAVNRNSITEDDIRSTAVFERQLNSNKAIANLLDIVDQLRANVKAAQGDRIVLEQELRIAMSVQRNNQDKVKNAADKVQRLNQAIKALEDKINILNRDLISLQNSFKGNSNTLTQQQTTIDNINRQLTAYETKLKDLADLIKSTEKQLAKVEQQISDTKRKVEDLTIQLNKKKNEISNIDILIDDAARDIKTIDVQIDDLKRRFNAVTDRKIKAEREETRLRNLKLNAPVQISNLESEIRSKSRAIQDLERKKDDLGDKIEDYNQQVDEIQAFQQQLQTKLSQMKIEITTVNSGKKDYENAIMNKKKEIDEAVSTLNFLKNQIGPFEQALAAAVNEVNQANARVQVAQQNFMAINTRYDSDNQQLQTALTNLQRARSEKELADLAMEQLLQERSDSLPYSIVPNGNGFTNPGTPIGNNPSGSARGPYPSTSNQIYSSLISQSTSSAPRNNNNIGLSRQYPFSLYRQVQSISSLTPFMGSSGNIVPGLYLGNGNQITFNGNFNCENNLSHRYEGVVKSVGNNAIKISTNNGQSVIGAISPCTVAQANSPNYSLSSGDAITFYGSSVSDGVFNISSLNCK